MQLSIADHTGFCPRVKCPIQIVDKLLESNNKKTFYFIPVIHNRQVLDWLDNKGLTHISPFSGIWPFSYAALPFYGATQESVKQTKRKKLNIVEKTRSYVSGVQKTCAYLCREKYQITIKALKIFNAICSDNIDRQEVIDMFAQDNEAMFIIYSSLVD